MLAAVAAGLRDLLRARGEHVKELVLRAMVPIALPIGEPDQVRSLQRIAAETAERKHKTRPQVGTRIFDPPSRNGPSRVCSPGNG